MDAIRGLRGQRGGRRPQRRNGDGGGGNAWLWNMGTVTEESEDDLADFGLQHLASDGHDPAYHAPLLGEDDVDVEDLMRNPMAETQQLQHRAESHQDEHVDVDSLMRNPDAGNHPTNRQEGGDEDGAFVLLKRLRLLPKNEGFAYVADLDAFFSSLYNYYYMRGLGSIIGKGVVELATLFFTLWLSLILFAYIDWRGLAQCNDEHTCHESFVDSYIIQSPFSSGSFLGNTWIVVYCLLFSTYGFFCLLQFGHGIIASLECKAFLEEILGVSDRDLEVSRIGWGQLVERMSEAQRVGRCRVAILPGRTAEDISQSRSNAAMPLQREEDDGPTGHLVVAQRIMRRENYMVAFFNKGLLDLTVPSLPPRMWPLTRLTNAPKEEKTVFFSKSIEWSIYFCVLNYMYNNAKRVRPAFYGDPSSLKRRFFLCGVAHAVFMPFLLFFVTLHFFMSNIYDWQREKQFMGPREWSSVARWTFREFNELPHSFERRLDPSYKSAAAYMDMFSRPSPFKVALGRMLVFVSGSLGTLLLAFAAMNDAILLHVRIGQWNLLWYAGVLGACFSIGKGMLPTPTSPHFGHARRNLIKDMNVELEKLATHTHYLPDAWRGKGWDDRTKKAFAPMFQAKANLFVHEIFSIVAAPLILCISLPRCAEKMCKFVRDSKVEVPGVGDVVGYSTFDFDSFEDENWRNKGEMDRSSKISISDTRFGMKINDRPKSRNGKMEKSFFNFKGVYPNWKMPDSGKNLVDQVESYRHQQDIALARERRLHIDAAAAQLDTLRRLETEREKRASAGLARYVDDRHISHASSGPDSGGGGTPGVHQSSHSEALSDAGSFGSFPHDLHNPHFEESAHSFAPPSNAFAHSSLANRSPRVSPGSAAQFDPGLSTEMRGLLNQSTLYDSQQSFTGSLVPIEDTAASILDFRADQQYALLDRYHSQQQQNRHRDEARHY
ncbi:hypothetical protein ACHAXT_004511 [Thalassiosira profunda]